MTATDLDRSALPTGPGHRLLRVAVAIERADGLDPLVRRIRPVADALVRPRRRRDLLQGAWLSHSAHPLFVTVPLGMWTAVSMLDLLADDVSRTAARRLTAWGVVFAVPSAVTGLAEWTGANQRDRRTARVHAITNIMGSGLYVASWRSRRRNRHLRGAFLAGLGYSAVNVGGFLGGHLTEGRKVASRHPALDEA